MRHTFIGHATIYLVTALAILLAVFGVLFWDVIASEAPILPPAEVMAEYIDIPSRITIPSIAVDAQIESVGLKPDGSMDVPKDPMNVGWFAFGPRPGQIGSSALAGHMNWWYGTTGVFANLSKVQPGDIVTVQSDSGETTTFVVREIRIFNANADATDVFVSTDSQAHLNLITCEGAWDKETQQYAERLVVFTDRVQE